MRLCSSTTCSLAALAVLASAAAAPPASPPHVQAPVQSERTQRGGDLRLRWSEEARAAALRRAVVWRPGGVARGTSAEQSGGSTGNPFVCHFKPDQVGGTTPKFECTTDTGQTVKVKYAGAEPHAEVAATRLMRAVGFPADDVTFVERVRCHGCPAFPFLTMKVLGLVDAARLYGRSLDNAAYRDIAWAAVERKHPGTEIETPRGRGWAWFELRRLRAPVAHVDALRLMAVFLAHWDNKSENQRLVCLDSAPSALERGHCVEPLALVQDLGATFGPRKVNLRGWRGASIWADRASCLVSMADMPHGGSTFPPVRVSEAGRRWLAERLATLDAPAIRALFEGARFPHHDGEPVEAWVEAFEQKVREIRDGPPCPK